MTDRISFAEWMNHQAWKLAYEIEYFKMNLREKFFLKSVFQYKNMQHTQRRKKVEIYRVAISSHGYQPGIRYRNEDSLEEKLKDFSCEMISHSNI